MEKQSALIIDFDGTLYPMDNRLKYVEADDWESFHASASLEKPNKWCLEIISKFKSQHYKILFITGRPIQYQDEAEVWLMSECGVRPSQYELFMTPGMRDVVYKKKVYEEHIRDRYDVLFVLDDRPSCVDMWRSMGLMCLQPNFIDH